MAKVGTIIKNIFKAVGVVILAFLEAITVSFYQNIKKHWSGNPKEYKQVNVPKDYKDTKMEPEYKDLTNSSPVSGESNDFDFRGMSGFGN